MRHLRDICCVGLLFLFSGGTIALGGEPSKVPQTRNNFVMPASERKEPAKSKHLDEIIYYEDWENGLDGWVSHDLTDLPGSWHIDSWNAYGGTGMSWCVGQHPIYCDTVGYDNSWYMVLDSPPFTLPAASCSLTFWHRVACEIPGGEPPGYNAWDGCNLRISTDDGIHWTIITNQYISPAYDRSSLYGFGFEYGEGMGVPGWVGQHLTWFLQSVSLNPWAGQTVRLRWAFASDVAWSTCDNPGSRWAFGWQVDNIRVFSGADTIFSNNGDNDSGWYSHSNIPVAGDLWRVANNCDPPPCPPPSGSHYLACNDSVSLSYNDNMYNEILSPYIDLRGLEPGTITADFQVAGFLGSSPDNFPDCDFWHWEVSQDSGATWWYESTPCGEGYGSYVFADVPEQWTSFAIAYDVPFDMSCYIGSVVRIKAVMESNGDGLTGVGPCFDDFALTYHTGFPHDMSCYTLRVPFPTTQGRRIPCLAYFVNAGSENESGVPAWWRQEGGYDHRLVPNLALAPGQTATRSFTWTPAAAGMTMLLAWTWLDEEQNPGNDTSYCPNIGVRGPAEDLELGYDNRTIQHQFNYETGNGVAVRFTPGQDSIRQPFRLDAVRMQFEEYQEEPEQFGLHIFRDEGGVPGSEIFAQTVTVTPPGEVYPNWKEVPLDGPLGGICTSGDFWVWLEVLNNAPENRYPLILGDDAEPWENYEHFYTYRLGDTPQLQPYFYIVRVLLTEGVQCPTIGYVTLVSFGPPDWGYRLHWVSGSISRLVFTDFCQGTVGFLTGDAWMDGWTATNSSDSIVFSNLFDPLVVGSIDTLWLSHPTCSDVVTWTAGDSSGTVEGPLPVELTTFEAIAGDGQVTLHWRTESELDNNHFVLYKRKAREESFCTLAEIPGHGTTTEPHDYQYVDRSVRNNITYEYQISDVDIAGRETLHEQIASATPSAAAVPTEFALHAPYPNPFNPMVTIRYDVKETGLISVKIFDLLGREVATLVHGTVQSGIYSIEWNAGDSPSGVYLCRMEARDFTQTRKVVLLK
jgi:hypothetical protein